MHIIKRGGVYYFRRRIPQDLVAAHGGQREAIHALRTKHRPEAMREALRAAVALDDQWWEMRGIPSMASLAAPLKTKPARSTVCVVPAAEAPAPTAPAGGLADMLPIWKHQRRPNDKTEHAYTRACRRVQRAASLPCREGHHAHDGCHVSRQVASGRQVGRDRERTHGLPA